MATEKFTWSYRIAAKFGPADLLRIGLAIADDKRFRDASMEYDFDWLKRRVAFVGKSLPPVEEATGILQSRVSRKAGEGQLLPGKPDFTPDGRNTIPIGVLIQDPESFREMMVEGLYEAGMGGITLDPNDGGHFLLRPSGPAAKLPWRELITTFPLPPYLFLEERKIDDK